MISMAGSKTFTPPTTVALPTARTQPVIAPFSRQKIAIIGPKGCGKTSLAAEVPDAIFLCAEPGHSQVSIYQLPVNEPAFRSWTDVRNAVHTLLTVKHDFKTVVVDTYDSMFNLCRDYVLAREGLHHESEDMRMGRGWSLVKTEWNAFIQQIIRVGGVIFLGHEEERRVTLINDSGTKRELQESNYIGTQLSDKQFYPMAANCDVVMRMQTIPLANGGAEVWFQTKPSPTCVFPKDRTGSLPATLKVPREHAYAALERHWQDACRLRNPHALTVAELPDVFLPMTSEQLRSIKAHAVSSCSGGEIAPLLSALEETFGAKPSALDSKMFSAIMEFITQWSDAPAAESEDAAPNQPPTPVAPEDGDLAATTSDSDDHNTDQTTT
jgi:hypothetical protein